MRYSSIHPTKFIPMVLTALLVLILLQSWAAAAPDRRPQVYSPAFGHVVEGGARCDLDLDGDKDFIVGAPYTDRGTGAVYVFSGDDYSLLAVLEGEDRGDWFGYSIDAVGDVNLDGRPDLLIGAPLADHYADGVELVDAGKVYLYSMPPTPGSNDLKSNLTKKPQPPYWGYQAGTQAGQRFGWSVSSGGLMIDDADDEIDDYYDFIVGSPGWDEGAKAGAGKVNVFKGGASSDWNDFVSIFESDETWHAAGDSAGYTVIGDWDFIGVDFLPDFAYSSPYRQGVLFDDVGSVTLVTYSWLTGNYFGGDNQLKGSDPEEHFGWSLTIGHLDLGDVYPDLVVGSPGYGNDQGRISCYHGGPTVYPFNLSHFRKYGDDPGDRFGFAVGFTPSVYDGNAEAFTVGAPQGGTAPGYSRLFYYTLTDWGQRTYDDDADNGDRFGFSVSRGGPDPAQPTKKRMIIGAPGAGLAGEAWIYVEGVRIRVISPTESYDPGAKSLAITKGMGKRAGILTSMACPNPFNPKTDIRFTLPLAAAVRLDVFNLKGQRLTTLIDASLPAGDQRFTWEPENQPSGTYFYRLQVGKDVQYKKIVLLK